MHASNSETQRGYDTDGERSASALAALVRLLARQAARELLESEVKE